MLQSYLNMKYFTCDICKLQLPALYEGDISKQSIKVIPSWTTEPILVHYLGEPVYPCPECEKYDEYFSSAKITDWNSPNVKLHKRLRQHFARQHHVKLKDRLSSREVGVPV